VGNDSDKLARYGRRELSAVEDAKEHFSHIEQHLFSHLHHVGAACKQVVGLRASRHSPHVRPPPVQDFSGNKGKKTQFKKIQS